ncbi:MAG: PAS domain-containing protein [Nitrospirae bacterium]|nr:MAG: PAS domain-containing protein [Nitrospirota bacterium]
MFKQRIIYRLLLVFIIFALIFIIPFSLTIRKEINTVISEEEGLFPPSLKEKEILHKLTGRIMDKALVFSLYLFVFAFLLSMFFSRSLLKPIRELYRGAKALKEGNLGIRLEVGSEDELGEVTKSFNEMAEELEKKTEDLKTKESYIGAMMDPLWVVADNDTITDINPAFTKLFGYSRDEVIGASIYDFLDEENARIMKYQLDEREKGMSSIYEISIIAKDGSSMPVLITGAPIIKEGATIKKIGVLKDFRREHELRNAIKESRDYLETIMDSIEDELMVVDRNFKIIMANKTIRAIKGDKVIGDYCYSISHDMSAPCWREGEDCPAKRVFETGKIFKTVHQRKGAGGQRLFHEVVACPIKDSKGNVMHVIELRRDVTERKEYEEKIAQKNKELTAVNSISGILSRSLKAEEIFGNVMDKMLEMIGMNGGIIFLLDEAGRDLTCSYHKGVSEEFIRASGRMKLGEDIPGKVAATGQLITTSDIGTDQRIERSILKHSGMKGCCAIPIKGKERVVGVFCLFSFKTHIFTLEEERLMISIGEMTGIAIENIRLYEKMRRLYEYQQQRRIDDHKNLLSLSSRLAAALEIKAVMNSTLDLIRGSFRADLVWLLEIDNENFILKAASGLNIKEGEIIYEKGTSSIEWYAVEKKEPVVVPSVSSDSRFYLSDYVGSGYRSAICLPVYVGEKALGALTLYYAIPKELRDDDIHFLQIVSSIVAVALERSELYEKTLLEREMSDTILQSISDGIMTLDTGCKIISINKAAADMIGISPEKAAGNQCCEIFNYTEENTDFRWLIGNCLENALEKKSVNVEAQFTTINGKRLNVMISSSPVIDSKNRVAGVVHVLRNITREKEIDRMKTELVRTVSHQFRTPLSAIVGMTEMLINEDVRDEKKKEYLRTVLSEGIRLSNMVGDLLNIARIESGKEIFAEEEIDFAALLEDTKKLFSNAIERKKSRLTTVINGDIGGFMGDKEKIFQLMKNFVDNSIIFSDEGCNIGITLSRKADNIELKVSDTGWGIPEEDLPHMTERFYRGKYGQDVKGTGLGLALCKEIAVRYNGSITFDSKVGKGTTVTATFPFPKDHANRRKS